MNPFLWFLLIILLIVVAVGWFMRGAVTSIRSAIADHAKFYTVAWIVGGCLVFSQGMASFRQAVHGLTADQIHDMLWTDWVQVFFTPLEVMCLAVVAFFNREIKRAGDAKNAAEAEGKTP